MGPNDKFVVLVVLFCVVLFCRRHPPILLMKNTFQIPTSLQVLDLLRILIHIRFVPVGVVSSFVQNTCNIVLFPVFLNNLLESSECSWNVRNIRVLLKAVM